MCGIIGVFNYGSNEDANRESALYFTSTLVEFTEPRGKDATGMAALFDDGNFVCQKGAVSASKFVARFGNEPTDFNGFLSVLRLREEPLRTVIGHCRKKSVGGSANNANNHPIRAGNIVGVHNGTLKNDDIIFEKLKCTRDGQVDSEAIFRLFDYYTKNGKEPFTMDMVEEVVRRLEGSFSILTFNANNPNQVVAARDQRPAEFCLIKPLKLMLVASEKKFIENAIWNYNKLAYHFDMNGFVKLKYGDVEYSVLKDDHSVIFYLTREITDKTKIEDLYDVKAMPKALDRIWKSPVQTYSHYGTGYNYNRQNNNVVKHTPATNTANSIDTAGVDTAGVDKNKVENDKVKSESDNIVGRVWSASMKKFVSTQSPIGVTCKVGKTHTVIDTEKKIIMSLHEAVRENEDDSRVDSECFRDIPFDNYEDELTLSQCPVENYKSDEINTIIPIAAIENTKEIHKDSTFLVKEEEQKKPNMLLLEHIKKNAVKGKGVMSDELNASKEAGDALDTFEKFESSEEVADLCNTEKTSLEFLPMQFLANRIIRHCFKKIFIMGWMAKKKEIEQTDLSKDKSKHERHIIALKHIVYALDKMLINKTKDTISPEDIIKVSKEEGLENRTELRTIKSIFSEGDLLNRDNIKKLINHFATK